MPHEIRLPIKSRGGWYTSAFLVRPSANLPRGPAEGSAAEKVQMQVKNRLPGACSVVQHRAITGEKIQLARQLRRDELQLAEHGLILGTGLVQRSKMFARTNQDVRGRLRADVFKREHLVIL